MNELNPSITISLFVTAFFTLILPIVLLIVLGVKRKISGLPLLFGALAFFISQVLIRIPILNALGGQAWFLRFAENSSLLYILLLSFTAGLFEESARLGGAALLKKHRSFKDIISFGLGHGICEVIILVGINMFVNAMLAANIKNPIVTATLPADTLQLLHSQLAAAVPVSVYLSIVERISAVLFHIFATILVFKGVIDKKIRYYLLAILCHTLFNLIGVLTLQYSDNLFITEAVILMMGLAAGVYILSARKSFAGQETAT
jgi:uncharacterized membrane protein YhfC